MTEEEKLKAQIILARTITQREARTRFTAFLGYIHQDYKAEWFHRLIADKCQQLLTNQEGAKRNLMVFVPPQHGKEISDSTPIPTPGGMMQHGEIKAGDYVFGRDGKPARVIATSEKVQSEYVVTFSDGSKIECHGNHEWVLYCRTSHKEITIETKELAAARLYIGDGTRGGRYIYQADANTAIQFDEQQTQIDPYTLGAWLGDGDKSGGILHIGGGDVEIVQSLPYDFHENKGTTTRKFYSPTLNKELQQCGLIGRKHIPAGYKFNSMETRKALIAGLIDTDGYVYPKTGRVTISNTNKAIVDDAAFILRSLGESVSVCSFAPSTSSSGVVGRKEVYQLCFTPSTEYPTRVPRKCVTACKTKRRRAVVSVERVENLEFGNCIQVEGGVYLVGETFIPTHNSQIISRSFPAWALGLNPGLKIAGCSYSSDLAQQFSRAIQRTMDSDEYTAIFPNTRLSGRGKGEAARNADFFEVVGAGGFYKAVGVGGPLTGTPVDIAIIDDPVKDAAEAYSAVYRQRVWEWYNSVLTTRLHNKSRQLFIMTRWHEDDLAGRILKAEPDEWEVLTIPAICESEGDNGLSKRKAGEPLWPSRHSLEKLLKHKQRAPREFNALYQQHPTIDGGNIIKREWIKTITPQEFAALHYEEPIQFYLDTAYNKKSQTADNDPSGILAACRVGNTIYLVDAQKVYKEMPDLLRFIPDYMHANRATEGSILHVEPKANGISVIHMIKEISTINVKQTPTPTESKETRLRAVSARVECGRVAMVAGAWNEDFLNELCAFPAAPHDEFVDILVYAINDLYNEEADIDLDNIDKAMFGLI